MTRPGRPQKENADYFSHDADASNDEKVVYLESVFGHAGYALYFKLIERLCRADNFEIEINPIKYAVYAQKFNTDLETFTAFINEATRKEIRAFVIDGEKLYSPGLKKRMEYLVQRREYRRDKYNKKEPNHDETAICDDETAICDDETAICDGRNPQSKGKKSKVKYSKALDKERGARKYFLPQHKVLDTEPFLAAWDDFTKYRIEIRKPLTETAITKHLNFLALQPDPVACIEQSINRHWVGVFEIKDAAGKKQPSEVELKFLRGEIG